LTPVPQLVDLQGGHNKLAANFCPYLRQILPDFQFFFTGTFCRKFVIKWLPNHTLTASLHYLAKYRVKSINMWYKMNKGLEFNFLAHPVTHCRLIMFTNTESVPKAKHLI